MGKNWTQSNFYMESLIFYRIHMGIRQKMNIDAMQKYHKIQHFHQKMTLFNEHAIFRVMTRSEFNQKRKKCVKTCFCRPSKARWPNLMSRSDKTTPDAPTDTVATPLSEVCRERRGERMMHIMLSFSVHVWNLFSSMPKTFGNVGRKIRGSREIMWLFAADILQTSKK